MLHEQGLDEIVVRKLRLEVPPADLSGMARWFLDRLDSFIRMAR